MALADDEALMRGRVEVVANTEKESVGVVV